MIYIINDDLQIDKMLQRGTMRSGFDRTETVGFNRERKNAWSFAQSKERFMNNIKCSPRSQPSRPAPWGLGLATALALAIAPGSALLAQEAFIPGEPEEGVEIPAATVRLGLKPYADNSFYVIGIQKGFFSDVGIEISPEGGMTLSEENFNALIMNGEIDISGSFPPNSLPVYTTSDVVKQIMFTDVIYAGSVLANPKFELKTFKEYYEEGMSFEEALAAALEPLDGQTLVAPPTISERGFEEGLSTLSGVNFSLQIMDDSAALVAARSGQIDFAHPAGAPIVYSMMEAGWTRIVGLDDLITYGPSGPDSPIIPLVQKVGTIASGEFVNANPNTTLRFLSAVWRTIDAVIEDPSLYDLQAPYLNSVAGTDLTGEGIAATVTNFHPYVPYGDNARFYEDEESLVYYKPVYGALIDGFVENGILEEDSVTPEQFVWGDALWREMRMYQEETDALFAGIDAEALSAEDAELLEQARTFYSWHNYLDAYRLALAISE